MPDSNLAIIENEKYSVREFFPGTFGGIVGDGFGILYGGGADLLPRWGSFACDRQLRAYHYMLHNQLWSGAHDIFIQKVLSTPYEISGGRNLTYKWQDIFFESEFGEGYDVLVSKCITDYLTLNRGMFIEIVSMGDPDTPLKDGARVLGLNHLDALRISFTGNLEYPYMYYSEQSGKVNRMHRTRVIHIAHSPTPDTRMFGMGRSPLYAALSSVNAQILLGRHQNEMLNDMPPPGLITFTNVKGEDVQNAMQMFEAERRKEGQQVYRAPMRIEGKDPAQPVTVTFTPLAQVPTDFDRKKYMEVDVNLMALVTQLDPQDIWPLSGGGLGNGQQSKELASKTQIKGPGYLLTRLERVWNGVTPRPLEFKYKAQNQDQDLSVALIAEKWTAIINDASFANQMEKRQLAANQIPAFADVLMDEAGNVRLPDDDPKVMGEDVIADDMAQLDTVGTTPRAIPDEMLELPEQAPGKFPFKQPGGADAPPAQEMSKPASPFGKPAAEPVEPPAPKVPNATPEATPASAPATDFKSVETLLNAGLITIGEAQRRMSIPVDASLAGYYMLDGVPVPPDKMRDLWQSRFGRGVASFDAVLAGDPMTTNVAYEVTKEYDATKTAFTDDVAAILQDAADGGVSKSSFSARMRSSINTYGKAAYKDGLDTGGVEVDSFEGDDSDAFAGILAGQSVYVSDIAARLYKEDGTLIANADYNAGLWANKTLTPFYQAGLMSADKNGMYEWQYGDTEHCATCLAMNGQKHRMKEYMDKGILPQSDALDCGGFNCQCQLVKTKGKSKGSWA